MSVIPFPKNKRWRSERYLKYVRSLPCAYCGKPADHAHHLIGVGSLGGMGTKAPDWATLPSCAVCHSRIHQGSWSIMVNVQWEHITRTFGKAIDDGVLVLSDGRKK